MKSKLFLTATTFATIALLTSGCSTVFNRSNQPVKVISNPIGASFEITNRAGQSVGSGTTPATVRLATSSGYFNGETYTVKFTKGGAPAKTVTLDASISPWYWGNFLIGGLVGMLIIDPLSGSMWTLDESVMADLNAPLASGLRIMERSQLPKHLEKHLVAVSVKK